MYNNFLIKKKIHVELSDCLLYYAIYPVFIAHTYNILVGLKVLSSEMDPAEIRFIR